MGRGRLSTCRLAVSEIDSASHALWLLSLLLSPLALITLPLSLSRSFTRSISPSPLSLSLSSENIGFPLRCNPSESVLTDKNPTCDIRTYVGGLSTCHHGWHLLDADQEVPWMDQPLEYWFKFRMYYQPYVAAQPGKMEKSSCAAPQTSTDQVGGVVAGDCPAGKGWPNMTQAECCARCDALADCDLFIHLPSTNVCYAVKGSTGTKAATDRTLGRKQDSKGKPASHTQIQDITWSIGGATGEYDVPRCAPGTPTKDCIHEITGTVTPPQDDLHFVAAHYHCHAPTCLSLEIRYGNATGELICKETPYHGLGADLVSGGATDRFDEAGYIGQRVCLWGEPPLEPPPLVSGKLLWIKAVTNSTYGHHGEMALPQMLLANLPKAE